MWICGCGKENSNKFDYCTDCGLKKNYNQIDGKCFILVIELLGAKDIPKVIEKRNSKIGLTADFIRTEMFNIVNDKVNNHPLIKENCIKQLKWGSDTWYLCFDDLNNTIEIAKSIFLDLHSEVIDKKYYLIKPTACIAFGFPKFDKTDLPIDNTSIEALEICSKNDSFEINITEGVYNSGVSSINDRKLKKQKKKVKFYNGGKDKEININVYEIDWLE